MKAPWFKFRRQAETAVQPAQMRSTAPSHPFGALSDYVPLGRAEISLFRAIREAIPLVDAALLKIIRLTGGVSAVCADKGEEAALNAFLQHVPTGRGQWGVQSFLDAYLDSLLTCGQAVGEMVAGVRSGQLEALLCGDVSSIELHEGDSPLSLHIAQRDADGQLRVLPRQELLLFTPYNPQPDHPYGVSILQGMPFLADILLKIYQSIGLNWERVGNARFAVVCKPGSAADGMLAADRAAQIAGAWTDAMQPSSPGRVRDFVAVGDVDIRVIGADNQMLDSQVPVRQMLEQLIARTGIPPFMLGLNWSSTERMSSQQADLMTSELTALRRTVTPVLTRVCHLWQALEGRPQTARIEWEIINLQDEVEEARAALYHAQAEKLKGAEL